MFLSVVKFSWGWLCQLSMIPEHYFWYWFVLTMIAFPPRAFVLHQGALQRGVCSENTISFITKSKDYHLKFTLQRKTVYNIEYYNRKGKSSSSSFKCSFFFYGIIWRKIWKMKKDRFLSDCFFLIKINKLQIKSY